MGNNQSNDLSPQNEEESDHEISEEQDVGQEREASDEDEENRRFSTFYFRPTIFSAATRLGRLSEWITGRRRAAYSRAMKELGDSNEVFNS